MLPVNAQTISAMYETKEMALGMGLHLYPKTQFG
jgi:hypothetical protein